MESNDGSYFPIRNILANFPEKYKHHDGKILPFLIKRLSALTTATADCRCKLKVSYCPL